MHMADALIAPAVAGTMYVFSAAAAAHSVHRVRLENDQKKIPEMGVMGAFVFAAQMINFSIPGTGSSGHICGGMLLTALLGPQAAFLTMIAVLVIQCLFFADGGLLALGCNIWNMAFYGCFVGGYLIWKPLMAKGATKKRITLAAVIGSIITLQLGAFSVVLETKLSGITQLPFAVFAGTMQPIHLAIGLVEGLITAAVLCFVHEARPEMLWGAEKQGEGRFSFRTTVAILLIAALVIGGGLSLFASSHPDGLEWALEKVAGTAELEAEGSAYQTASDIQEATAVLPDYAVEGSDSPAGTTLSGVAGSLAVLVVSVLACWAFRFFRHRGSNQKRA
ncbi:MAG: energy-coupling factor ABC transporter permease [Clostridia bacterium]|nr:energy-coupling factor ABC transporter permease [Clostridia bacterium]